MVQQILQTTFSAGASQTAEQMGMASAPSPSGGQSGNMSQTASANMNSGM
jgi:hypothetical protein